MRILFLQKRFLFPTDTGGKIRTLNVVRHLAKWHEVTYLCNEQQDDAAHRDAMCDLGVRLETIPWKEAPRYSLPFYRDLALNLGSRYPYNVNKDYDPGLRRRVAEILANKAVDLVVCDFVQMARNVIGLNMPASILFEHNVEAQIFQRHANTDRSLARRAYMWLQWKKMSRFERQAGLAFDRVIAVSEADRKIYKEQYDWSHVDVIDTSVDVDYFRPSEGGEVPGRLVFVGSMDWLPNIDGMQFFCNEVLPLIRQRRADAQVQIVGRNPAADVLKLGAQEGVEVTGSVSDTRPYLASADVVVVPLRIGGGTRLKIPEAMAMRKAIVSTPLGAEGLPVSDGVNIVLAKEAGEFANQVCELLDNQAARNSLGQAGLQLVSERFTSEAVARQFEAVCKQVTRPEAATAR